ncbi:MAG: cupin domain-containing protein [Candidatus Bathyarchaeota archaeon]|nr:cupin domain-containing protein [Candidatus Bathyarchaeota archaeon]
MSIRVRKLSEEPGDDVQEEGFTGVNSVWAVLKRTDLTGFSSRIFRMEPGGHTAAHSHEREHVAVVIKGRCRVEGGGETMDVGEGNIITVPADASHRFSNPGRDRLVLLIMNLFTEPGPGAEATEEEG